MKYLLMTALFFGSSLFAKELLKDPEFKKFEKNWKFNKKSEYNYLKTPKIRRGVLSIETKHKSESPYVYITTFTPIKPNTDYTLTLSTKGNGEGSIQMGIRSTIKPKEAIRNINLGLQARVTPGKEWEKHEVKFTSKGNFSDKNKPQLIITFGKYLGKVELKDLSLKTVK